MADRPFPISEELAELVAALRPGPGRVMVDVACSEGLYARALAAAGSTVIALDHSRPFLKRVVERARHDDLPIAAVRGLAQHLPVGDGAVVGVGIGGSLNEIGDKADAVAEAARVLSPDGRLFSMSLVAARTSRGRAVQRLAGAAGIDFPSETVTVDLAERAGLTPIDQRRDGVVLRLTAERPAAEG
jgi:ubiquinone/menaquinone biosynthesis C-methylase UbiE